MANIRFNVKNDHVLNFSKMKNRSSNITRGEYIPIVNAVEIDWNAAVLPNGNPSDAGEKTINTTEQLLDLINSMQNEIYVLTAAVVALAQK